MLKRAAKNPILAWGRRAPASLFYNSVATVGRSKVAFISKETTRNPTPKTIIKRGEIDYPQG